MVTLTPKAVAKVKRTLDQDGKPNGCLRLKIASGGCSGMSYEFEFADAPQAGDKIFETDGATLAVDPRGLLFINGSTVDWHQSLMESGFRVTNPNATAACNCGTSFSTQPTTGAELFK